MKSSVTPYAKAIRDFDRSWILPEQGQLPLARGLIVAQDIHAAIVGLHPKVPVIGGEPSIDNLHYLDAPIAKVDGTRFLFATMASVALHTKLHGLSLGIATTPICRLVQAEHCVRDKSWRVSYPRGANEFGPMKAVASDQRARFDSIFDP